MKRILLAPSHVIQSPVYNNHPANYDVTAFIKEEERQKINPVVLDAILKIPTPEPNSYYSGRKRARIDFLNEDQKMMRRKIMNRMAAQQARDRKKERIDVLETAVHTLSSENVFLKSENEKIKMRCEQLSQQLLNLYNSINNNSVGQVTSVSVAEPESAALNSLQQRWFAMILVWIVLPMIQYPLLRFLSILNWAIRQITECLIICNSFMISLMQMHQNCVTTMLILCPHSAVT